MPVNTGAIELTFPDPATDQTTWVRVYYDNTGPASSTQPIVNQVGKALEAHNPGQPFRIQVWRPDISNWDTIRVPAGDTSLTKNQLAAWGITTRGDVRVATIGDG